MLLKMWDVDLAVCKLTSVEDNMIYCIIKTQKLDMILAITQVYTGFVKCAVLHGDRHVKILISCQVCFQLMIIEA